MSNNYLKVTIETISKLRFSGFKKFVTRSVFGELQLTQISLNFKTSCYNLKIRGKGTNEKSHDILKSKSPCILLNKNINFNKNETESKMKNCTTFCFISYKNRKLKVKLWWVGACERKKGALFVPFILSKGSFFKICVLYQCIVYWIHFQNIHTFTIKKMLLYTIL